MNRHQCHSLFNSNAIFAQNLFTLTSDGDNFNLFQMTYSKRLQAVALKSSIIYFWRDLRFCVFLFELLSIEFSFFFSFSIYRWVSFISTQRSSLYSLVHFLFMIDRYTKFWWKKREKLISAVSGDRILRIDFQLKRIANWKRQPRNGDEKCQKWEKQIVWQLCTE